MFILFLIYNILLDSRIFGLFENNPPTKIHLLKFSVAKTALFRQINGIWINFALIFFSSCTSSFCVSSSHPTSSRASGKKSSIRNSCFNFWNFSTVKILENVTSSRLSSTGYMENSSGYGHSLGSKLTTFSSSKHPKFTHATASWWGPGTNLC